MEVMRERRESESESTSNHAKLSTSAPHTLHVARHSQASQDPQHKPFRQPQRTHKQGPTHHTHIRRHTRRHNHTIKTSASRRSATPHPTTSDAASAWAASRSLWSASRSPSSARRVATRGWRPWSLPPSGRRTAARGVSSAGSGNSRTRRAFPSSRLDPSRMRRQ